MLKWLRSRIRCTILDEHVRPWGRAHCRYCGRWLT